MLPGLRPLRRELQEVLPFRLASLFVPIEGSVSWCVPLFLLSLKVAYA